MKIISVTDTSRYGNDCYVNETVSLVGQFDIYAVIICRKISGWYEEESIFVEKVFNDYDEALAAYEDCDGVLKE